MRHLLDDQLCLPPTSTIRPDSIKQLAKYRIQGLNRSSARDPHPLNCGAPSSPNPSSHCGSISISAEQRQTEKAIHTVYCPFSVAMNHFKTLSIRSCSFTPCEIEAKSSGCSHQYAGNSVRETGDRMTEVTKYQLVPR